MNESKSPFRYPGEPLVVEAWPYDGRVQFVSFGVQMAVAKADVSDLALENADVILGNCTTTIPMKFDFDSMDAGHTVVIGPAGKGMSALKADIDA